MELDVFSNALAMVFFNVLDVSYLVGHIDLAIVHSPEVVAEMAVASHSHLAVTEPVAFPKYEDDTDDRLASLSWLVKACSSSTCSTQSSNHQNKLML